jgi:hypothetical protein
MRFRSSVKRFAVTGALALPLFGLGVTPALAGENEQISTEGGSVVFTHRGEILLAEDERRDGYGVGAFLTWNDDFGGHQAKVVDGHAGGRPARRNLSLPEGTTVWLEICYTKHGRGVKCSLTQRAEA